MDAVVIGIDVQVRRRCPFAVMDSSATVIDSGWIDLGDDPTRFCTLAKQYRDAVFAIDAPRLALPAPREWYWKRGRWAKRSPKDKGNGRHCEVVIAAHKLANPQWTPVAEHAPEWMRHGFSIYEALRERARCLEVFPTTSYKMLEDVANVRFTTPLLRFQRGPKDMLDAIVGAITVLEFLAGRGQEVGGGDGLGTIVIPRPIVAPIVEVLQWPGS